LDIPSPARYNAGMTSADMLDCAGYACPVEGLGPGKRLILWVRGCARGCPGCIAPEMQTPGVPAPVAEIAAALRPLLSAVDGITLSGGEPFAQPAALAALIDLLRVERDVEVLVFSGFLLEELQAREDAAPLLARADILIDGPFLDTAPNTLQWRGSDNQRVHLLTPRAQCYAGTVDAPMPDERPLQVQMLSPSRFRIIGIPRRGDLARYRDLMAERGMATRADTE
jgi:anaerobic ribonucleoside-triphosphate reductase activating protein